MSEGLTKETIDRYRRVCESVEEFAEIKGLSTNNDEIRRAYKMGNKFVLITKYGNQLATGPSHSNIQKRLNRYARVYGLKNINPHALRRGFAKSLLEKGANLTDISRALGHSDLSVTTKYLYLDKNEVAENLRRFL
ncbi:site-specific integrase [Bacillus haynesii]|nr:tyrosine-type recombinase/integrase [Bacillus haynesii]